MALSIEDIQRIAYLARIEITAAEAQDVQRKLDRIFDLINEMRSVDTGGIMPMAHAQDVTAPLREDRVSETDRHALYQSEAPAVHDDFYLVPKVIE
jgi:aspartyl-tRNA(Asn)/glutamyl-tRNA(Gln) amidotransferase subunit C